MVTVVNRRNGRTPGAIYAGRPGPMGNPFTVEKYGRGTAVDKFEEWFQSEEPKAVELRNNVLDLPYDAILECWCVPERCHAQFIADWVNKTRGVPA